jgi:hypothetical protein
MVIYHLMKQRAFAQTDSGQASEKLYRYKIHRFQKGSPFSPPLVCLFQDPFATDVYLNGHLLPDTVDTATTADAAAGAAAAAPVDFLQRIPVAPLTGSATAAASGGGGGGGLVLPPISIAFLCYTSE